MSIGFILLGIACLYMFWNLKDLREENKKLKVDSEKAYSELYDLKKENRRLELEDMKLGNKYAKSLGEVINLKNQISDLKKELNKF